MCLHIVTVVSGSTRGKGSQASYVFSNFNCHFNESNLFNGFGHSLLFSFLTDCKMDHTKQQPSECHGEYVVKHSFPLSQSEG